jgi:hypothetical protein
LPPPLQPFLCLTLFPLAGGARFRRGKERIFGYLLNNWLDNQVGVFVVRALLYSVKYYRLIRAKNGLDNHYTGLKPVPAF